MNDPQRVTDKCIRLIVIVLHGARNVLGLLILVLVLCAPLIGFAQSGTGFEELPYKKLLKTYDAWRTMKYEATAQSYLYSSVQRTSDSSDRRQFQSTFFGTLGDQFRSQLKKTILQKHAARVRQFNARADALKTRIKRARQRGDNQTLTQLGTRYAQLRKNRFSTPCGGNDSAAAFCDPVDPAHLTVEFGDGSEDTLIFPIGLLRNFSEKQGAVELPLDPGNGVTSDEWLIGSAHKEMIATPSAGKQTTARAYICRRDTDQATTSVDVDPNDSLEGLSIAETAFEGRGGTAPENATLVTDCAWRSVTVSPPKGIKDDVIALDFIEEGTNEILERLSSLDPLDTLTLDQRLHDYAINAGLYKNEPNSEFLLAINKVNKSLAARILLGKEGYQSTPSRVGEQSRFVPFTPREIRKVASGLRFGQRTHERRAAYQEWYRQTYGQYDQRFGGKIGYDWDKAWVNAYDKQLTAVERKTGITCSANARGNICDPNAYLESIGCNVEFTECSYP